MSTERAASTFVIVGLGGLGCPAIAGLLAAGARRFVLVDPDVVDTSNLQRQILYRHADRGLAKVEGAARWLLARAPGSVIERHALTLDADLLERLLGEHTDALVLECSDDAKLKFLVNDMCVRAARRAVIGAALGWRGQVMSIAPGHACYRCIYEEAPLDAQACSEAGVFAPVCGFIGLCMAKLAMADPASTHAGYLTHFDGRSSEVRRLQPRPRAGCNACAEAPSFRSTSSARACASS